jgi:hypothetical protein
MKSNDQRTNPSSKDLHEYNQVLLYVWLNHVTYFSMLSSLSNFSYLVTFLN